MFGGRPSMIEEHIAYAAIRRTDNCIVYGKNHIECFNVTPRGLCGNVEQGFMTNKFRFVDRKEAFVIAVFADQIKTMPGQTTLISEMLWDVTSGGVHSYDPAIGYFKTDTSG